jgi:hypothetical protein
MRRRAAAAAAALSLAAAALPAGAAAQGERTPGSVPAPVLDGVLPVKPREYELTAREAIRIADRSPDVVAQSRARGRLKARAEAKPPFTWQIGYLEDDEEVVQVLVTDPTGQIKESWTGHQVAWQMARGYEAQFGHSLNAPYVWIPLALIFFFALFDFRRGRRIVHLDLLVLLSFGISQIAFDAGEIGVSVPLAYPPLLYLLGRMLWVGFRGGSGLRPSAPVSWLAIGAAFLVAFRIALNIADSGVIDVGYAGVIGADRITHGEAIYGGFPEDNRFGDTYGPANYLAYVPLELVMPWHGDWDALPASHGAAIVFDLATVAGLFFAGRRLRPPSGGDRSQGTALGVTLAFGWLAYPYSIYALQSNSNDSLVAALLVWAVVAISSPAARGALIGFASLTKFAPLALAPLFLTGERGLADRLQGGRPRWPVLRPVAVASLAFVVVCVALLAWPTVEPGLGTFYERTIESQIDRESPFSIWGQVEGLEWAQTALRVAALMLAVAVAFVPRRRQPAQVAALAAAVLIAVLLGTDHLFYLYIPWFAALVLIAIGRGVDPPLVPADGKPAAS